MREKLQRRRVAAMGEGEQKALLSAIGGIDASVIMGTVPEKSIFTLWAERSGRVMPEEPDERARFDRDSETYIARRFQQETGKQLRRVDDLIRNPAYPFAYGMTRWLVLGENAGLTCACVSRMNLRRFGAGRYPPQQYYQCLHEMLLTGRRVWYLAALLPQKDFQVFRITAEESELQALAQAERQFWLRVERGVAPVPDGSTSTRRTLDLLYPGGEELSQDLSDSALLLHEYLRWKALRDEAEKAMRSRETAIKDRLGNANRGHMGQIQVRWLPKCRMKLDVDTLRREHPEVELEKYQLPVMERVFQVYRGEDGDA